LRAKRWPMPAPIRKNVAAVIIMVNVLIPPSKNTYL
jgi:hypothetical protein